MDSGGEGGTRGPGSGAGDDALAIQAALTRHAESLTDVRRHALSVSLLSWDSPAGGAFRTYLVERCSELSGTIELLHSAARLLGEYGRLLRAAEELQRGAGL
ncbi:MULTISPECIES: hypothetical protein [unclassified Arthrobacter]|uniref:hypothetical protein n=1 Tax=Arthrobacter sp. Leaf234 TaxID=1736303 RepID=UPI000700518E|nr:hypothetical protein [Arthrobacter sp. Leaf234]KQO03301.1 hypothetical protein ASF21_03065 [Arthrobacter sp. Leaf234]